MCLWFFTFLVELVSPETKTYENWFDDAWKQEAVKTIVAEAVFDKWNFMVRRNEQETANLWKPLILLSMVSLKHFKMGKKTRAKSPWKY